MVSDAQARPTRTTTENRVTALEAERPHMATTADIARIQTTIEGMPRTLIMWLVGVGAVLGSAGLAAFLHILSRLS